MRRKYLFDEQTVRDAVVGVRTRKEAMERLGLKPVGGNYKLLKSYFVRFNIDTSHILGFAHLKGTTRKGMGGPLSEILVKNSTYYHTSTLKKRLIDNELIEYKCHFCDITHWRGEPLSLHLDHVDGDPTNNEIKNLRLLCPNCHSQTNTYCGRNTKKPEPHCVDCGVKVSKGSTRCNKCSCKKFHQTKIEWPVTEILLQLVAEKLKLPKY